jgi:hypothetical protein
MTFFRVQSDQPLFPPYVSALLFKDQMFEEDDFDVKKKREEEPPTPNKKAKKSKSKKPVEDEDDDDDDELKGTAANAQNKHHCHVVDESIKMVLLHLLLLVLILDH